jgi:uncharacterized protein YggE
MEIRIDRKRLAVVVALIALVLVAGVIVVAAQGSSGTNRAGASSPATPADTVSVSGTGSVEGVPDTLIAQFRIHTKQGTVQAALNRSSIDTHAVSSKLHSLGVALVDIKSTDLSLNPSYDMHGNQDGYDASESLTVHIHPLTKVGQIIAAATTAPTDNSVSIDGLSFDIADNSALLAQARRAAFDNAKAAAAQYAELGGRSLARVMTVKAVVHNPTPIYAANGFADTAGASQALKAPVPIRPGQKKVSVTVSVVWALN